MYWKPHPIREANACPENEMSRHGQDMPANLRRGHVIARDDGSFQPTIEVPDAFCHCEDNWRSQMCCSSGNKCFRSLGVLISRRPSFNPK